MPTLVLVLLVIFGGVALITYVDNTTRARRQALGTGGARAGELPAGADEPGPASEPIETLLLRLPEPSRTRAWTLLCEVADGQGEPNTDARTAYLLAQTRTSYLPDTVRAYLGLSTGARQALETQGQSPERLLDEQLRLIEDGVREALRRDHAAADRLLTQGRFLRERFGTGDGLR